MKLALQASMLLALVVGGVMGSPAQAQTQLFITDDQGVHRYNFQSSALTTLVPDTADPGGFTGLAQGPNGNLFVAATLSAPQIFQYNPVTGAQIGPGPFVNYEGDPPTPDPHDVIGPQGMHFSPTNGDLYVADISNSNAHRYDGSSGSSVGTLESNFLVQPRDLTFDAAGDLFIVNPNLANVLKSVGGTQPFTDFVAQQSGGLNNPIALTFGPDDKLYVLDLSEFNIKRYNTNGSFDTIFADLGFFEGSDMDFGPDGKLYVSGNDFFSGTSQIIRLTSDGSSDGVLIDEGLTNPHYLLFAAVPEPSGLALAGIGLLGAARLLRRRKTLATDTHG